MIRNLLEKDSFLMYQCMCDKKVTEFMRINDNNLTIDDCLSFIKKSKEDKNNIHFAITDESDNWVGTISLKNIDKDINAAEYAIITSSHVHGKGYAYTATQELIKYAFEELNLNKIYLNVVVNNIKANKFYIKCGFKLEGTFKDAIFIKGNIYDLNWYAMLKREYLGVSND